MYTEKLLHLLLKVWSVYCRGNIKPLPLEGRVIIS